MLKQRFFNSIAPMAAIAPMLVLGWCVASPLTSSGPAAENPWNDSQILGIYIQVNGFDIETALLGGARAKSESVRQLAHRVASDHLGVRQTAYDLAGQCNVPIDLPGGRDQAAVEHGKAMAHLLSLSGQSFDKAFAQHEVGFHRAAIEAVRSTLLPAATCPALKAHLNDVLPAFQHHLAQTEAIEHRLAAH
jgi:putative membrane protein